MQRLSWLAFTLVSSLSIVAGCMPSSRTSLRDEYARRHGWGWPIDSLGPYYITVRLNTDSADTVGSADSVDFIDGALKADYVLGSDRESKVLNLPRIVIDSLCIHATDGSTTCLPLTRSEGSGNWLSEQVWEGPTFIAEAAPMHCDNLPIAYTYRASLTKSSTGEVIASHKFRHRLKVYLRSTGWCFDFPDYLEYPNPFCPTSEIQYFVTNTCPVLCVVYDVQGKVVDTLVHEIQTLGHHSATLNTSGLLSGVYFYRISVCDEVTTKKAMLLK